MTSIKRKLVEMFLLIAGGTASISSWIEGQKPWVALLILTGVLGLDEILIRLDRSSDSTKTK